MTNHETGTGAPRADGTPSAGTPAQQNIAWATWLRGMLIDRRFAHLDNEGNLHYHIRDLEQAIARALPAEQHVPYPTLRAVMRLETMPTHSTARGLAAAFGVSEVAVLLRSGQLDWDAVTPLVGPVPALLRSEDDVRSAIETAKREVSDPTFRARVIELIEHERQFTLWLSARLRWLGISEAEYEQIRQDLNSPDGRMRLVRALYGPNATPDDVDNYALPSLPKEFLRGGNSA
jgi:hypothetical protein